MQEERDTLILTDEDGNELELEILRFFFYNGEEYAMVAEVEEGCGCEQCDCEHEHEHEDCDCEQCDCDHEPLEVFFMKVEPVDDENEEYSFVDEELSEELMKVIEAELDEEEDE